MVALNASAIYFGIGLGTLAGGIAIAHGVAMMFVVAATAAVCALAFLTITAKQAVHRAMGEEASP